jgi:hypothetical protein
MSDLFGGPDEDALNREHDKDMLQCPGCGGVHLHQVRTMVFEREEDAVWTIVSDVTRSGTNVATVPSDLSGNPSDRRQGLAIKFTCEECPAQPELTFQQHKGTTYVAWRNTSRLRLVSEVAA